MTGYQLDELVSLFAESISNGAAIARPGANFGGPQGVVVLQRSRDRSCQRWRGWTNPAFGCYLRQLCPPEIHPCHQSTVHKLDKCDTSVTLWDICLQPAKARPIHPPTVGDALSWYPYRPSEPARQASTCTSPASRLTHSPRGTCNSPASRLTRSSSWTYLPSWYSYQPSKAHTSPASGSACSLGWCRYQPDNQVNLLATLVPAPARRAGRAACRAGTCTSPVSRPTRLLGWYRYQLCKQLYRLAGLVQISACWAGTGTSSSRQAHTCSPELSASRCVPDRQEPLASCCVPARRDPLASRCL
ncbi:hypothetical protein PCASD_14495 [Puccinia coronata f. sp. avenae]|uniref:Uncharacterized protein n=1 Tax=Puccinia coronata f. sp. avenae TaxID=200324 RepID=A0A2N5TEW9_9BASI|nr:hypothetical protein PCASD_14495 [Puccinia coronata f. sp. avenae]